MFTGLIHAVGVLKALRPNGEGLRLDIDVGGLAVEPAIGASVAVNGVCLTVTALAGHVAGFDAVAETVSRSTLGALRVGARVNLEPALRVGDPLDGHWVLGHVDATGEVLGVTPRGESEVWRFSLPSALAPLVAVKGSIAVDGISLTVAEVGAGWFSVSVIPHTRSMTTLADRRVGDAVNLEADVLARYLARLGSAGSGGVSLSFLRENGFA